MTVTETVIRRFFDLSEEQKYKVLAFIEKLAIQPTKQKSSSEDSTSDTIDAEWQQTLRELAEFRSQQKMSDQSTLDDVIAIRGKARY